MHCRIFRTFAFALVLAAVPILPARAAGGVQVVVIEPHSPGVWIAHEFVDNAIVKDSVETQEMGGSMLLSAIECPDETPGGVSIVSARSVPLVVFAAEHVDASEERLAEAARAREAAELESEMRRQLLDGFFQVPFWPYLAASELPLRGIDLERAYRLPHERREFFPAAAYAGTGSVPRWRVIGISDHGVALEESGSDGEGEGISIEYHLEVDPLECSVCLRRAASVSVLYVGDDRGRVLSGAEALEVPVVELLAPLDFISNDSEPVVRYAVTRTEDEVGVLGRYLAAPPASEGLWQARWVTSAREDTFSPQPTGPSVDLPIVVVLCWFAFGLALLCANALYRFASIGTPQFLACALASYPLYLALSFLACGLWGMGFIPASAALARLFAPEGKRLAAFGSVLAASFFAALVSSVVAR